jgi:hypothetical protein
VRKYKEKLVEKGFQEIHGIYYDETFSPIEKMESIFLALAIATAKGCEFHQTDVKNYFLHGDLSDEMYMEHS